MEITNPEKFAQKQHLASSAGELYKLIRKYGVTPFDGIEIKFISETVASTSELNSNDRVIYCSNGNDAAVGQFLLERDNGSSKTYYVSWPMDYPANASPTQKIDRRWRKNFYESASDQKPWQDRMFVATNGYILWGEVSNISGGGSAGGGSFLTFDGLLIGKPTIVSGGEITSGDEILLANGSSSRSFILHGKRPNPSTGQIDDLYWDTWSDASGLRPSSSYNDSIKQARKDYLFMSTVGYVVEGEFVNIDELSTKIAANKVAISSNKNHISVLEDYNGTIVDPHVNNVHAHNRILNVNKLDIVYNGMTIERDVAAALCGQYLVYDGQNAYNGIINASIDTNGTALHQFYIGTQNLTKGPTVLANKVVLLHRSYSISNKVWSNWEYWSKESEGYNALDTRVSNNESSLGMAEQYITQNTNAISALQRALQLVEEDYATKEELSTQIAERGFHRFHIVEKSDITIVNDGSTIVKFDSSKNDKIVFSSKHRLFCLRREVLNVEGKTITYYASFTDDNGEFVGTLYNYLDETVIPAALKVRKDYFYVSSDGYILNGFLYAPDTTDIENRLTTLEETVEEIANEYVTQDQLDAQGTRLNEAERDIDALETEVSNIWSELDIDDVQSTVGGINERVTNNENNITLLEGKQQTLETQFDSMSATWSASLNNLDARVIANADNIKKNADDIEEHRIELNDHENKIGNIFSVQLPNVNKRIDDLVGIQFKTEFVDSIEDLPTDPNEHTIYMVPAAKEGVKNYYDEYIWRSDIGESGAYEQIGSSEIDLSDYSKFADNNRIIAALSGLYGEINISEWGAHIALRLKAGDKIKVVPVSTPPAGAQVNVTIGQGTTVKDFNREIDVRAGAEYLAVKLSTTGTQYMMPFFARIFIINASECLEIMTEADVDEIFSNLV